MKSIMNENNMDGRTCAEGARCRAVYCTPQKGNASERPPHWQAPRAVRLGEKEPRHMAHATKHEGKTIIETPRSARRLPDHLRQAVCTARAWLAQAWRRLATEKPQGGGTSTGDVFKLSIPLFVELFMQIMVGNVNQVMLSPFGTDPAAAVGNALQILNIVTIALSAMGTASTVLITRLVGRRDAARAVSEIATTSLAVNVLLAGVLTAVLAAFWPQLFALLNVDPAIRGLAGGFLLVVASTTVVQGAFFAVTALLRAYARVGSVMAASLVMNVVNIGVSGALMTWWATTPEAAVESAAWANVAARFVGLGLAAWLLVRRTCVRPHARYLWPFPWATLKKMLGVGIPSSGEQMNYDIAQIVILSFVNVLGTTVVTVKVYCSLIAGLAYLYSIALSQATQIVLGYLFGAGKLDAIARRVWATDLIAIMLTTAASTVIWANSDAILGLLTTDAQVLALGKQILFIEIFLGVGRALNIVMVKALIAVGDVRTPVAVNVLSSWLFAVAGGYLLGIGLGWGLAGMWIAMCVDEWLRAGFLLFTFARGGWRRRAEAAAVA